MGARPLPLRSLPPCAVVAMLVACGEPAVVTTAAPDVVRPGRAVTLGGTGFDEDLVVTMRHLVDPDATPQTWSEPRAVPVAALSPTRATLDLPEDLAPGTWVLGAGEGLPIGPAGPTGSHGRLEVWTPETDPPCAKHHAIDVQTSRTKRMVVVRRLFTDGDPETITVQGDDLKQLIVGRTGTCAWVRLARTGGPDLLLFDAHDAHDRARQAAEGLASVLDVPWRQD